MFVAGMAVVSSSFAFRWNEEVSTAIETNDYAAFVEVAPAKLLEKVTSETDFLAFVSEKEEKKAAHEAMKSELEKAVVSNDFEAFLAIKEGAKAQKAASRPDDDPERPELSEEDLAKKELKMQEKFEKLVTYYNENGELPERSMKKWKRGGHGDCNSAWGQRWERGQRWE